MTDEEETDDLSTDSPDYEDDYYNTADAGYLGFRNGFLKQFWF